MFRPLQNLKRWEIAERQRRKAARESVGSAESSSLVQDVARRASWLWPAKRSVKQAPPKGPGQHHQLRNSEDEVALDDIDTRITSSPVPETQNPFVTPAASTVSLNTAETPAIMQESDSQKTLAGDDAVVAPDPKRPSLGRSPSSKQPPPKPLDLPAPRSPPPRTGTPHADRPPEPIPPPDATGHESELEEDVPPKRWWTDWLCGCREGGDHQVNYLSSRPVSVDLTSLFRPVVPIHLSRVSSILSLL